MRAILSDINIQGHVSLLYAALVSPSLAEIWATVQLPRMKFADLGLPPRTPDLEVWQFCQREQYLLITANQTTTVPIL